MASVTNINIKLALNDSAATVLSAMLNQGDPWRKVVEYIESIATGIVGGKLIYNIEHTATPATQTIAFDSSAGTDGDTITIGEFIFTAKDSPSLDPVLGEFLLYADSDTAQAVAFKNAWNSHPVARHLALATNVTSTVTLTAHDGGVLLNQINCAVSTALFSTLGAATFANGAAGTNSLDPTVDTGCCSIL